MISARQSSNSSVHNTLKRHTIWFFLSWLSTASASCMSWSSLASALIRWRQTPEKQWYINNWYIMISHFEIQAICLNTLHIVLHINILHTLFCFLVILAILCFISLFLSSLLFPLSLEGCPLTITGSSTLWSWRWRNVLRTCEQCQLTRELPVLHYPHT